MDKILGQAKRQSRLLKVHTVNDYACYIGAPERPPARLGDSLRRVGALPPLAEPLYLWSLGLSKNYDVYALFIGDEELEELFYGQIRYTLSQHALMCVAPGQIGGKTDTGEEIQTKGWALLFDTELLRNSELGRRISETAESLGFEYPLHFTRQFKKYFGITPTEFLHK